MRWIAACAIGEAIGIAAVSLAYAAGDRQYPEFAGGLILAGGLVEGIALGGAQALAAKLRPVRWIGATVAAALIGYGLSLLAQGAAAGGEGAGHGAAAEPGILMALFAGAGLGLFMGALFGWLQSLALPAGLSKPGWIVRNIVGWAGAMAIIMLGASLAGADWPLFRVALLGAVSGAGAGGLLGIATKGGLQRRAA